MYVVGAFRHSVKLEIAIAELEASGLTAAHILAIPLEKRFAKHRMYDTMAHSDGVSYVELAAILGMIGMLLGCIYGFVLAWGPILWALIGLVGGFLLGYGISFWFHRRKRKRAARTSSVSTEVFLLVNCPDWQADKVRDILWEAEASGVSAFQSDRSGAVP